MTLGSDQVIKFDHIIENYGSAYNSLNGVFTSPVNGIYLFAVTVMTGNQNYVHVTIVKNGSPIAYIFGPPHDGMTGSQVVFVHLQAGDRVLVKHQSGYGPQTIHKQYTSFFWMFDKQ